MSQQYTIEEVKRHKNEKSAWIIIHNDVYDVTSFLNEHPGGPDSLLDVAGIDGTQPFEDVGHSEDARIMMKKYKIGTIPPGESTKVIETCCKTRPKKKVRPQNECADCTASSTPAPLKSDYKSQTSPRPERRVQSIIVPRERRPWRCPEPPPTSSRLKWALLALAGAIVVGFVIKKYAS